MRSDLKTRVRDLVDLKMGWWMRAKRSTARPERATREHEPHPRDPSRHSSKTFTHDPYGLRDESKEMDAASSPVQVPETKRKKDKEVEFVAPVSHSRRGPSTVMGWRTWRSML